MDGKTAFSVTACHHAHQSAPGHCFLRLANCWPKGPLKLGTIFILFLISAWLTVELSYAYRTRSCSGISNVFWRTAMRMYHLSWHTMKLRRSSQDPSQIDLAASRQFMPNPDAFISCPCSYTNQADDAVSVQSCCFLLTLSSLIDPVKYPQLFVSRMQLV